MWTANVGKIWALDNIWTQRGSPKNEILDLLGIIFSFFLFSLWGGGGVKGVFNTSNITEITNKSKTSLPWFLHIEYLILQAKVHKKMFLNPNCFL